MKSIIKYIGPGRYSVWAKKKPVAILSIVSVSIALGYLFFLSCLLGVLICKYISGESVGERGKVRSIVFPFKRWRIHLHHWLYAGCLLVVFSITNVQFLHPMITFGFLGGLVFQGIYFYSDWHRIVVRRHKTRLTAVMTPNFAQYVPAELDMPGNETFQLTPHIAGIERTATLYKSEQSQHTTAE